MIAAQPKKWGGAYAARLVRQTLATFRHPVPPMRPAWCHDCRSHHPEVTPWTRHPRQPSPGAFALQPAARRHAPRRVVQTTPPRCPLDSPARTIERLVTQ